MDHNTPGVAYQSGETHQTHHVTQPIVYYVVYVLLVIFMLLTVGASYVNMGSLNNLVAMTIATIKAVLVVLFFMQVRTGTRLTWVWAAIGFIWLIFLFGTLGDYVTRNWISVTGW